MNHNIENQGDRVKQFQVSFSPLTCKKIQTRQYINKGRNTVIVPKTERCNTFHDSWTMRQVGGKISSNDSFYSLAVK